MIRKIGLFALVITCTANAAETVPTSTKGWTECIFESSGDKPVTTTIYIKDEGADDTPVIGYKSGKAGSTARLIDHANGYSSERVAYAMFIEKIYGIELRRSVKVWLDDMNSELAVSSRTPGLTEWTSNEMTKGSCKKVDDVAGLPD